MPSERHINRQVEWRTELQKYGCKVSLERTVSIRGARVIVDVYVEVEGKTFLIEIGDISDERKTALMQYHAEDNPNIQFIHEDYGENKIPEVLESVTAYRNSPEYKRLTHQRMLFEQQRKKAEREARRNKRYILYTILIMWFIPSITLMFFDPSMALYWFAGYFLLVFLSPFIIDIGLAFLGMPLGLSFFLISLFESLKQPTEKTETKPTEETEDKEKTKECHVCGRQVEEDEYFVCSNCGEITCNSCGDGDQCNLCIEMKFSCLIFSI